VEEGTDKKETKSEGVVYSDCMNEDIRIWVGATKLFKATRK
jgi:hypothetical protein